MEKDKVSVILPIYNQEPYLRNSIPAVLNQSYENLEVICVNDGSTDNSKAIIDDFAKADPRVKAINRHNGGLSAAIITGVERATGDFVCFLDPDDFIGNRFIETFINEIEDFDFVSAGYYSNINGVDFENRISQPSSYCENEIQELRNIFLFDRRTGSLSSKIFVSRWNKMYRMDCLKAVIEEYKVCCSVSLGEDTIFTYLLLCHSHKGKTLATINSYHYRIGSQTSMMSNGSIDKHLEKAKEAKRVFDYILGKHGDDQQHSLFLYYYLVESLRQRLKKNSEDIDVKYLEMLMKKDVDYQKALNCLIKQTQGLKKVRFIAKKYSLFLV